MDNQFYFIESDGYLHFHSRASYPSDDSQHKKDYCGNRKINGGPGTPHLQKPFPRPRTLRDNQLRYVLTGITKLNRNSLANASSFYYFVPVPNPEPSLRTNLITFAFLASVFAFACSKKPDQNLPIPPEEEIVNKPDSFVDKLVKASIQGRVLNQDGSPIAGASVEAGKNITTTDENGIFTFKDIQTGQQFSMVRVEKEGYLTGSRSVPADEASDLFVEIQLTEKTLKGVFEAHSKVVVDLGGNTSVTFNELNVVTQTGVSYTGKVSIYGRVLDPTSENFVRVIPGNMLGVTAKQSITGLSTYGIVSLVMEGESGEKLQLSPGGVGSIRMSIPENIRSNAPQSISMWHFDERRGFWFEEDTAAREGDYYVGDVSHFSSWGFNVAEEFVELSMNIINDDSAGVPYVNVRLYDRDRRYATFSYTNVNGHATILAQKGTPLTLEIAGHCNQILLSKEIGAFDSDKNIGIIPVSSYTEALLNGRVVDVDGRPIERGVVRGHLAGLTYVADVIEGEYHLSVDMCDASSGSLMLEAQDLANGMMSEEVRLNFVQGSNANEEILIRLPKPIEEYVKFTFDGFTREFIPGEDTLMVEFYQNRATILFLQDRIYPTQWANLLSFDLPDSVICTNRKSNDLSYNFKPDGYYQARDSSAYVTITKYGKLYESIEGRFVGHLYRWGGDTTVKSVLPITGEFSIRRRRPR